MIRLYLSKCRYAFLLVFLASSMAMAQQVVTGTVTSADDGSQLPGVNILEKGTTNGTVTDVDGTFRISVGSNATLVLSFVGYTTQEIAVGAQTTLKISLQPDVTSLSEVVVVGYGTVQKKDLTGSVAQVSSKDFNAGVNVNPLQAIQGKVAGLNITTASGDPNASPTVRLRGYTSLAGGSDPLYVVDGVIGVPINSVSPNDIETIDVLKDASAAAIYGSRGANGVIIITTKRGKSGKTTVTFNNYISAATISHRLPLMDADEYRAAVTSISGPASLSDGLRFPAGNYNTDWIKEITRTAMTNNHELAMMGGTDQLSYRASVNYIKQDGIVKNTGLDRMTGRFNLDQKALNNKLNIQYNLAFTQTNSHLSNPDIVARATTMIPTVPVYSGNPNKYAGYYEVEGSFDLFNPVAMLNNYHNDESRKVFIGGLNLRYEILPGLTISANGAYRNENMEKGEAYNKDVKAYATNSGNTRRRLEQTNNKLLELTANYVKTFNNSKLTILGGYSYQNNIDDGFEANNNNYIQGLYPLIGYDNLSLGKATLLSGKSSYAQSYRNEWSLISFFARGTFDVNDRFNVTATVRQDGSSKFGANNKWGTFPSVGAGWTISNESFMAGQTAVSLLKLRLGYGTTGNSEGIGPYKSIALYGPRGNYYDGGVQNFVPGMGPVQNANPNLKWEVLTTANIGLDFEFGGGKWQGSLDVYQKNTKDMLFPYTVPVGDPNHPEYIFPTIVANVGEMTNKGIELTIGTTAIRTSDFQWNTRVVASYYKNAIKNLNSSSGDLGVGVVRYNAFGGRGLSDVYASQLMPGHPLGEFYIPTFAGFDPASGKVLMQPKDGDAPTDDYSKALLTAQGQSQPRVTASWINTFTYKRFDMSFQLRGVFGNKIMNNLRSNLAIPGSILQTNMLKEVTNYPTNYGTNQLSSLWLESGSFARLDNWQIGYNIPTGNSLLTNARVYIGGNNLFIITKYKGIDPELEVKGDLSIDSATGFQQQTPNPMGMDATGIYPKTRTFMLGVNLTF